MTPEERRRRIAILRDFPDRLEARVQPLTDAQLDQRTAPSEWSTRQIVHHLADSHMSANFRFRLPLTEDNPRLPTYDQEAWARMADYTLPIGPSLQIVRGLHERWVALLQTLTEDDWAKPCTHPDWGPSTLEDVLRVYSDHCENHMAQIDSIGAQYGW